MIKPPVGTNTKYTAIFDRSSIQPISSIFSMDNKLNAVILSSKAIPCDIECMNELISLGSRLSQELGGVHEMKFNPLYIPHDDVMSVIDLEQETIDGMGADLALSTKIIMNQEEIFQGSVFYDAFELDINDMAKVENVQ